MSDEIQARNEGFGLPPRPFLYTLDQVQGLLGYSSLAHMKKTLVHFDKLSNGATNKKKLLARNIAPDDAEKAEWRISERELIRWMRAHNFRLYQRRPFI